MLKEYQLFTLLDKALNQSAHIRKGEEAVYFCPFCHHHHRKLEINVKTQEYHCWICHARGKSIRSLFYKLKLKESYFIDLYKIIDQSWCIKTDSSNDKKSFDLSLPNEFIPLWKFSKLSDYGIALSYLKSRNITMDDIIRYNIGYCENELYKKRIIIPSYDKDGNINFFTASTYYESNNYKYMLSPWSKDIIGFELFINWSEDVTLTEGCFDAISIRNNAIPLFGTTMSNKLKEKIILSGICRVNLLLDNDKAGIYGAMKIYEFLQQFDIDIHLITLNDKDASKEGFEKTTHIIDNSKSTNFKDIIKMKLNKV